MEFFILNYRKVKLIAKGAEANIYVDDGRLIKYRIKKEYRINELDERLRKSRTRHEAKLLKEAKGLIPVPSVYEIELEENKIVMEFINGVIVKDMIDSKNDVQVKDIGRKIGEYISRLHNMNLIHNDLTTSNMIMTDGEIYFIDFGLGTTSTKTEDKAMDLVVLKKSLMAAHTDKFEIVWDGIMGGYKSSKKFDEILNRMHVIERRVRYSE